MSKVAKEQQLVLSHETLHKGLSLLRKGFYSCHVIVDEIEYAISKVDPRKLLEVEGFRVDPTGNQKSKKVPYARSETHLTEVMEKLCSDMNKYARSTDKETGKLKYVRTDSRDGKPVTLENVSISGDTAEKLRYACENILEDHEEDIVKFFKDEAEDSKNGFCINKARLCTRSDGSDKKNEKNEEL